ncbi:MAG: hypothetical protein IIC60_10805 [Proteobacteria bacterium]|nr:hypothetical protein [Pseudomonadota bacterium]
MALTATAVVAQDYQAKLTEYGYPDLRGVWNLSTPTLLEHPEHSGNREFLTSAEIVDKARQKGRL